MARNHPACCPRLCTLLQLKQHIPTFVIVLEEVDIVEDEN